MKNLSTSLGLLLLAGLVSAQPAASAGKGSDGKPGPTGNELQSLPAGRPINLECGVRFGILGEEVSP